MLLSRCFFFLGTRVDQYSEIPWEHSLMPLPIYSIAAALIAKGRYHQRKQGFAVWSLGHSLLPLPAVVSPACWAQSRAFGNHCWRSTARRQERQHHTQLGSPRIFGVQVGFSQALFSYAHLSVLTVALLFFFAASLQGDKQVGRHLQRISEWM